MDRVLRSRGGTREQTLSDRNHHDMSALDEQSNENGRENGTNTTTHSNTPSVSTTIDVAQRLDEPTVENTSRRRMRWTDEMNLYLYQTYLRITKMETTKEPYSVKLHEAMIAKFPELANKTVQNILDQRRQLFKKNRLQQSDVIRIRMEVQREMGVNETTETTNHQAATEVEQDVVATTITDPASRPKIPRLKVNQNTFHQEATEIEQDVVATTSENEANDILHKNITLYLGTDPASRPKLPRLKVNQNTFPIITKVNDSIREVLPNHINIEGIQTLIYAAALTILDMNKQQINKQKNKTNINRDPPWERRIKNKIEKLRKQIGKVTQILKGNVKKRRTLIEADQILNTFRSDENNTIEEILDSMKQRLAVTSNRLRRYKESQLRRQQNAQFRVDQRNFYRTLNKNTNMQATTSNTTEIPKIDEMQTYWEHIWQSPVKHKTKTTWEEEERKRYKNLDIMSAITIYETDIKSAMSKTPNWRAPGVDKVHNFWYKKLTNTHQKLAQIFNEAIADPTKIPTFMTTGITYLLPKTTPPSAQPEKYRPITCLPTIYKLLTSILTEKIYRHLEHNDIIAEEQKGCRKNSRGCKEQLIIDSVIVGEAKKSKKQLFTAYIDYKKAFDSMPHTWLLEILNIYKINPQIVALLQELMNRWTTNLRVNIKETTHSLSNDPIKIQRGIFQGDSLSALWFCIALNPLSNLLNKKQNGYCLGNRNISHLLYMDDLKLFSSTEESLRTLLKKTENFSRDIGMEFGLEKCRINCMRRGEWQHIQDYHLRKATKEGHAVIGMEKEDAYKYLGFHQNRGINTKEIRDVLLQETHKRITQILKTKLSARNITTAVNAYALSVLVYSFGVIRWTDTQLGEINRSIRVLFTKHRAHHPKSSVERFHLSRKKGGRGILDIRNIHFDQIHQLRQFFYQKSLTSDLHNTIQKADNNISPLNLKNEQYIPISEIVTDQQKIENWKSKELHGRYIHYISQQHIDRDASLKWLSSGNIFVETEGFMVAIQDQTIPTLNYRKHIIRDPQVTSAVCRICKQKNETIEHILSACSVLAPKEYTRRHNNVAKIIHQQICKKYNVKNELTPYYRYEPETIITTERIKLYWNRTIHTDRTVMHNRPDITLTDLQTKTTYLIDISVPSPVNVASKYREKTEKYLPLAQDLKQVWGQEKVIIVPVIIGATGEIPTNLHHSLHTLDLPKHLYIQMQKIVILESCNITRRVLTNDTA